ncbi:MAG: M14 family metallopeptidase [Brachymonas sp.]|nr:M14 family metallopeptidase [Brachymonas sp.]
MEKRQIPLPCSIPGTETVLTVFEYGPPQAVRKVYIQASLHADELPGALVAWQLCQHLQALEAEQRLQARVVVVPLCNPLGLRQAVLYKQIGRFDLATGQNYNRLHTIPFYEQTWARLQSDGAPVLGADAAHNRASIRAAMQAALTACQPRHALEALHRCLLQLACDADVVLDLHCDKNAAVHLYTLPQIWPDVEPLARWLGSQCQIVSEDSQAHSFDEMLSTPWLKLQRALPDAAIPLACHAVTVELRGEYDVCMPWAQQDADAILQYLHHLGDVRLPEPAVRPCPPLLCAPHPLSGMVYVPAPMAGIVVYQVQAGDWVKRGQPLAEVVDPLQPCSVTVSSPIDGFVFARNDLRFASLEQNLMSISGAADLGHAGLSP